MSAPDLNELLQEAFIVQVKELLNRVKSGQASTADLECIRKVLKDNNIQALPAKNSPLAQLGLAAGSVPEFDDDDEYLNESA